MESSKKPNKQTRNRPRAVPATKSGIVYDYPDVGRKIGRAAGGMLGNFVAPGIGGQVGSAMGSELGQAAHYLTKRITGFGDYEVSKNALVYNEDAVPEFSNNERCTIITHREFVADIRSSVAFNLNSFRINPAIADTFPWLSAVAANYEQYVVQGMVYEFKTTSANAVASTNTGLGTVVMATQYNSLSPLFANKQQMENYEFAQSCVPSQSILHAIECDPTQTQCGGVFNMWDVNASSGDKRLYDVGRFNIATVGMQLGNVPIGELWVSYKICLLKPRLSGVTELADIYDLAVASVTSAAPLGTVGSATPQDQNSGFTTIVTTSAIELDPSFVGVIQLIYGVSAPVGVTTDTLPIITTSGNCTVVSNTFLGTGATSVNLLASSVNTGYAAYYVKCNGGYVPSTGALPRITFTGMNLVGGSFTVARLSIISMPGNLVGAV